MHWKLLKMLKMHESKINEMMASDAFNNIDDTYNAKVFSHPRHRLLQAIVNNIKLRLMNADCIAATNNVKEKKQYS